MPQPRPSTAASDVARLDGFELVHRLGGGGMAEVFLAKERGSERLVVIKRLRRHLVEAQSFLAMFIDEIQVTARLDHPHVVKLAAPGYSLVECFLVLEPISGLPLSKLLRRLNELTYGSPALSPGAAALLSAQIASGLHHAHTLRDEGGNPMNIVHRDVSPQNIMVTFAGQAKLIDFGVARLTGRAGHTQPGDLKGKLGYIAPEQVRPMGPITHRTDVFALGVVLWEMLTDKRLFLRKSPAESLRALLEDRVRRPSELRPIAPALDGIVMRALCPDPKDRFADAGEMAEALFAIVGADRKSAEAEVAQKLGLVRHARPKDFAAGSKAEVEFGVDSEPGTEPGTGPTVRKLAPTAGVRTSLAGRPGPSPASPRLPSARSQPPQHGHPSTFRGRARRFWRPSLPVVTWSLAALLLLDVGLRLREFALSAMAIFTARPELSGLTVSPLSPPHPAIVEQLPLLVRSRPPANDRGPLAPVAGLPTPVRSASETDPGAIGEPGLHPGTAETDRRRRLVNQTHPARSRNASALRRTRPHRDR